jgi:MFS family permease
MLDVTKHKFLKFLLSGTMYFSEGVGFALLTIILIFYLNDYGFPYYVTTFVVGITNIPWMIKFFWGGIADHFLKLGRKPFIVFGSLISAVGFFAVAFISPEFNIIAFTLALILADFGLALFDTAFDAWAIEISNENERGMINGAIQGGLAAGLVFGASVFGYFSKSYGYSLAFISGSLILVISILAFHLFVGENPRKKQRQKLSKILAKEFKKRSTQALSFFAPISTVGNGFLILAIPLYFSDRFGLDVAQTGLIYILFPLCRLFGSLVGGYITDLKEKKKVLTVYICALSVACVLLLAAQNWQMLAVFYGLFAFLHGGYGTAILAIFMDITNPRVGASQFSILTSLMNFGESGIGAITGTLLAIVGFSGVFLYAAWAYGPALLVIHFVKLRNMPAK